ncbi:protein PFC0760c-like [Mercenaria mercenaria]|uniref:protein PFC0760c-like n=1 Tax=Mercenaria mercenaria TaxID=6596 RepID=UPI00234F0CD4|nr:protein PFC0760c-like [Mercenaria mercenaria]
MRDEKTVSDGKDMRKENPVSDGIHHQTGMTEEKPVSLLALCASQGILASLVRCEERANPRPPAIEWASESGNVSAMQSMNLKPALFLMFCFILAASARPAKNENGNDEGKGDKGGKTQKRGPEKLLVKLCDGLENGDIANTDPNYDGVFTDLEPVCDDLLEFVDSQEEGGDNNDGNNDVSASIQNFGKKDGKKADKKDGNEEDKSSEDDGENDAVDALLGFCEKLENELEKGLPDNTPSELLAIFKSVDPICEDAEEIAESESEDSDEKGDKSPKGSPKKLLVRLCEGLENGDIANTDPDYDSVFTDLEPVCDDVLEFVDSEMENEEGGDVKNGRETQGSIQTFGKKDEKKGDKKDGKKGDKKDGNEEDKSSEDDGENDAVDALLGFCEKLENELEKGLPDNTPSELLAIFKSVDPICEDAEEIAESESEDSDEKGDKSPKGSPKKLLVRLCEGLENGDIANTDPDYDSVFTDLEPVCDDVLEFVDSEMENEEGGDVKNGRETQG